MPELNIAVFKEEKGVLCKEREYSLGAEKSKGVDPLEPPQRRCMMMTTSVVPNEAYSRPLPCQSNFLSISSVCVLV